MATPPFQINHLGETLIGDGVAVTPSDTVPAAGVGETIVPRAFWIGVAGDVVVKFASGRSVTIKNHPGGWLAISCPYIMAATTATNIVAVF